MDTKNYKKQANNMFMSDTPKVLQYRIFDMILGPIMPQKRIELIQYRQSLI